VGADGRHVWEDVYMNPTQEHSTIRPATSPLREAREAAGISQAILGRWAEVDPATIYNLERGKVALPRLDTARAIARALGRTPDELFPETRS